MTTYLITRMPAIEQLSLERRVGGGEGFVIYGIVEDTPQNRAAVGLSKEEIVNTVDEMGRDEYIKHNEEAFQKIAR